MYPGTSLRSVFRSDMDRSFRVGTELGLRPTLLVHPTQNPNQTTAIFEKDKGCIPRIREKVY